MGVILDSDELGDLGEGFFSTWCTSAKLIYNRSLSRDRAGWDFLIDFELDESGEGSLDHRKSPISCRVQQKTIWHTTDSVRLSLKMAERLAKDPGPSFISIMKIGEDHLPVDAYLLHMAGERLATVLKRLREEGVNASSDDLKDKAITFTPTLEERIAASGPALRARLKSHIGEDIHAYVERKKEELKTLGYESAAYSMTFEVDVNDEAAIGDLFLGLRDEIDVRNFEVWEHRFGISLPDGVPSSAKISIKPVSFDTGTVSFFADEASEPIVFPCEVFATPPVSKDRRMIFRSSLFEVLIQEVGGRRSLSFCLDPGEKEATIPEWLDYWRAMDVVRSGRGAIDLKLSSQPEPASASLSSMSETSGIGDTATSIEIFEALGRIARRACLSPSEKFSFHEVADAFEDIGRLQGLMRGTVSSTWIRFDGHVETLPVIPGDVLHVNCICVGKVTIAFYLLGTPAFHQDEQGLVLTLTNLALKRLAAVESLESYQAFAESAKRRESNEYLAAGPFRAALEVQVKGADEIQAGTDNNSDA